MQQLLGDDPNKGGHYITIWAPRQTGKTWIMQEVSLDFNKRLNLMWFFPLQFLDKPPMSIRWLNSLPGN
jgi:predicted AAA+ superfamily ATPase